MLDISVVAAIARISSLVVAYNITMSIMNDVLVCKISPLFIYPKQLKATYHTGCPILSGHFIQTESM